MSYENFLELTPKEFHDSLRERVEHEENIALSTIRTICETIRLQTFHLYNKDMKKKVTDIKKFWKFYWEQTYAAPQSKEEMKAIMKAISKAGKFKKDESKSKRRITRSVPRP